MTSLITMFFAIVAAAVALDWHMRGLGQKRLRRSLQAEAESYLRNPDRI